MKYVRYRIRRRSYVAVLAVRYVLDRDITERYLLSVYACSISANVGIAVDVVVLVVVLVPAVEGTTADAESGSLTNVRSTHANLLVPDRVV